MDKKGDHGGDSKQEMNAGLFFYSKKPFISQSLKFENNLEEAIKGIKHIDPEYDSFSVLDGDRTVPQIDLVPTLAALMGLAIPFGNLGTVIPEFFISHDYQELITATALNAKQVYEYLRVYGERRGDAKVAFQKSIHLYHLAVKMEKQVPNEQLEIYLAYTKFLRHTLLVARSIWSRFEPTLMAMGTIVLSLGVLVAYILQWRQLGNNIQSYGIAAVLGSFVGFVSPIRHLVYPNQESDTITLQAHHEILFFAFGFIIIAIILDCEQKLQNQVPHDATLSVASILTFLYACTVGSDSFLIFEDAVLLHFIQFLHVYTWFSYTFQNFTHKTGLFEKQARLAGAAIIMRIISLVTICRPDQGPYCIPTYNDSPTSSISAVWTLIPLTLLTLSSIVFIVRKSLKILVPFILCTGSSLIYWILQTLVNHQILPDNLIFIQNGFVYLYWLSLFYTLTFHFTPDTSIHIGLMFLILFQKPMGGIVLYLFYIYINLIRPFPTFKSLTFLTSWLVFFGTGHQNSLPTIQYDIGFIGLTEMNMILSPLFIAFNTFGGVLLITFCDGFDPALWLRQVTVVVGFTWHFARHSQVFNVLFNVGI
jgi:GPI ethanolamine phosphate transferase 3 subunit O